MQKSGGKVKAENYIIPRRIFRFKSRGRTMDGQESKAKPEVTDLHYEEERELQRRQIGKEESHHG
jgi:hypothetical protein